MMRASAIILILLVTVSPVAAQAGFGLAAGPGMVIRPERHATLGYEVGVFGIFPLSPGLHVRIEGAYQRFSPWQYSGDLCPPSGCAPDRDASTSISSVGAGILLRNRHVSRTYAMAGIGVYHMTEGGGTGETIPGLSAGLGINLTTHLSIGLRYHLVPKGDLARGMMPLSLTWNH